MIYLDNAATTKCCEDSIREIENALRNEYYNPAALYSPAVSVEQKVESSRVNLAEKFGSARSTISNTGDSFEIIFTSGATESNNIAIFSTLEKSRRKSGNVISGALEHPSVAKCFDASKKIGYNHVNLMYNDDASVNMNHLENILDEDTILVSIMSVNNEFGSINNISEISALIRNKSPEAIFHVDGVQEFCHSENIEGEVDLYSISAHKFAGPKGVGALRIKKGSKAVGQLGGGQEKNRRSGTLNVPGILGMNAAINYFYGDSQAKLDNMRACKEHLAKGLLDIDDVFINGPSYLDGAAHILNVSFVGIGGEVLLHALEDKNILVSTGSACSTKKKKTFETFQAIGLSATRGDSAIRFSFGENNTIQDMNIVLEEIKYNVRFLRQFRPR